jgi:hypothetical protein
MSTPMDTISLYRRDSIFLGVLRKIYFQQHPTIGDKHAGQCQHLA